MTAGPEGGRSGHRNKTGNIPWSQMSDFDRAWAVFRTFCLSLMASAMALALLALVAIALVGQSETEEMLWILSLPALLVGFGYTFWALRTTIQLVEKAYAEGNEIDPPINL